MPKQLYRRVGQSVRLCSFIITGHEIDLLNRFNMAVLDIGRFLTEKWLNTLFDQGKHDKWCMQHKYYVGITNSYT